MWKLSGQPTLCVINQLVVVAFVTGLSKRVIRATHLLGTSHHLVLFFIKANFWPSACKEEKKGPDSCQEGRVAMRNLGVLVTIRFICDARR